MSEIEARVAALEQMVADMLELIERLVGEQRNPMQDWLDGWKARLKERHS